MSFGQPDETAGKNADAEILAAIDEIEFDFGCDRFTTAQAGIKPSSVQCSAYSFKFELSKIKVWQVDVRFSCCK